jgi:hypothetical protein
MVLAMKLMPRFKPLKLAAVGIVALPLPIWLLGLARPARDACRRGMRECC